jgi:hypothetical protein
MLFDFAVGGASSADGGQIGGLNSKLSSSEGFFSVECKRFASTIEDRTKVGAFHDWGSWGSKKKNVSYLFLLFDKRAVQTEATLVKCSNDDASIT